MIVREKKITDDKWKRNLMQSCSFTSEIILLSFEQMVNSNSNSIFKDVHFHFHWILKTLTANIKLIAWYKSVSYSPSISQAIIAVKIGAEDLIVSEKETATYFKEMREHTIVANLGKGIEEKKPQ